MIQVFISFYVKLKYIALVAAVSTGAVLLATLPGSSQAAPVTWTINVDPFTVAGSPAQLSGSFDIDTANLPSEDITNISLNLSGVTFPGDPNNLFQANPSLNGEYTLYSSGNETGFVTVMDLDGNGIDPGDASVSLRFPNFPHLAFTGGTPILLTGTLGFCVNITGVDDCNAFQLAGFTGTAIAGTDLSAVPIPGALPLFLSGLIGLGLAVRRRRG
ncbi:MAG: hypothetical protein O3A84_14955 [Proteobacteria bacterium]|nr:hypothetical protein [Pseudomonadota bacterium]